MPHNAKAHAMRTLEEEIIEQNITPELAEQAHRLVIGDGSLDAKLIFIGEAPGKKEDETGLPFVGASGKFLDQLLESIGLHRPDVYITSIVKYRPPNNRDPKPSEKEAFWPYMVKQIEIIQPEIVVTLGRHSMGYFLPGVSIGEIHGQAQTVTIGERTVKVVPLYHPAAALYNGSLRQTLISDFINLQDVMLHR
jgi:uracil-DNA glycosylase family 4